MSLPSINVVFKSLAETAVTRAGRGTVLLCLPYAEDKENPIGTMIIKSVNDIPEGLSSDTAEYIKAVFLGSPKKVILLSYKGAMAEDTADGIENIIRNTEFDWATLIDYTIGIDEQEKLADIVADMRKSGKCVKAVVTGVKADNKGIVNVYMRSDASSYVPGDRIITKKDGGFYDITLLAARITGILAGMPLDSSATYYKIPEIEALYPVYTNTVAVDDVDAQGGMILIERNGSVMIGSGCTSLVTVTAPDTEDMKSIKIVEAMDLIANDIRSTFENNYIGKNNSYAMKQLFVGAVNQYFDELVREGVLYDEYDNRCELDVDGIRKWLIEHSVDVSEMTYEDIKKSNTGKDVFLRADIQLVNAIENLEFSIMMN